MIYDSLQEQPLPADTIPALRNQLSRIVPHFHEVAEMIDFAPFGENEDIIRHRVIQMAAERAITGFEEYGDTMFQWDDGELLRNMLEELADFIVYTSEMRERNRVGDNIEPKETK